jgi:hypothetical protein
VEFNILPSFSVAITAADYTAGRTSADYLKRLRKLEPGDPEWAFDLATTYYATLVHSAAPGATRGRQATSGP